MSRYGGSLPSAYFDDLYARDQDPWRFATSLYEREKHTATLEALPARRYGRILEIGCSIGVLTRRLAERCDELLAVDVSSVALAQAKARCADQPHVRFERRRAPDEWPPGRFDLILLSEVLYFLGGDDVSYLAERVDASTTPGAVVLLIHWLGDTNYPLTGDEATEMFLRKTAAERVHGRREAAYRLDVLRAKDNVRFRSVRAP